jgi:hypothetical protein
MPCPEPFTDGEEQLKSLLHTLQEHVLAKHGYNSRRRYPPQKTGQSHRWTYIGWGHAPRKARRSSIKEEPERKGRSSNLKSDLERSRIHHSTYLTLKAPLAQLKDRTKLVRIKNEESPMEMFLNICTYLKAAFPN